MQLRTACGPLMPDQAVWAELTRRIKSHLHVVLCTGPDEVPLMEHSVTDGLPWQVDQFLVCHPVHHISSSQSILVVSGHQMPCGVQATALGMSCFITPGDHHNKYGCRCAVILASQPFSGTMYCGSTALGSPPAEADMLPLSILPCCINRYTSSALPSVFAALSRLAWGSNYFHLTPVREPWIVCSPHNFDEP